MDKQSVLLVVALDEEYETLKSILKVTADHSTSNRIIHAHGECNDFKIFSVLSHEMGSHDAYEATHEALEIVRPSLVISVGIAGALDSDLKLLDVCVATEIVDLQHVNKVEGKEGGETIKYLPKVFNTDPELSSTCQFLISHHDLTESYKNWQSENSFKSDAGGGDRQPKMYRGPICCADVIASSTRKEAIKDLNRKILCVETEAGGVARAASKHRLPFLVVKGISDTADEEKANLEKVSAGNFRTGAMKSAVELILKQLENPWLATAVRNSSRYKTISGDIVTDSQHVLRDVTEYTIEKLRNISPEFQKRHDTAYLPLPRVYPIEGSTPHLRGDERPQLSIRACINDHRKSLVRLPRGYSVNTLGYSLALSLLRSPVSIRPMLPIVVDASKINPAQISIDRLTPFDFKIEDVNDIFDVVVICQNIPLNSETRMQALSKLVENKKCGFMFLSSTEDYVVERENFIKFNDIVEYDLAPISFSETALFIETTFGFEAAEADAIALKVDQTFRRFNLLADPTYYAGIDPDSLDALLNANQRAELIQLAISGLLSLLVARDTSTPRLTRTTRERFLRELAVLTRIESSPCSMETTKIQGRKFLKDNGFDLKENEFLRPFFDTGVLYEDAGEVKFGHPYLEAYLVANRLREDVDAALRYFDPEAIKFDFHTYDLYCELGPNQAVLDQVLTSSQTAVLAAAPLCGTIHPLLDSRLAAKLGGSVRQIAAMYGSADPKNEYDRPEKSKTKVREEKQSTIDLQRKVGKMVAEREYKRTDNISEEVRQEFEILDGLSRHLSLCIISVNAGAETVALDTKKDLVDKSIDLAWSFSNLWIKNRLRTDFDEIRDDMQSQDADKYYRDGDKLSKDLQIALFMQRIEHMSEPVENVLSRLCATASNVVLPIVRDASDRDSVAHVLRAAWLHELSPAYGKGVIGDALKNYSGSPILRLKLADHLLARLYWRHCGMGSAEHFLTSVQRALNPISLRLTDETKDRARQTKK